MVVRLEESAVAVASPALQRDDAALCTAVFDGQRYVFYALDAFVVVLRENHEHVNVSNPRSEAKRSSQFDLWQLWHASNGTGHLPSP
ncbi:hypothetical protein P43SY_008997 [Pythium insidiosum]|uniref:Uncharacterized protein n=1 Tax=Pythium insidiosum TaxID=114742 RepID=A0AAD5Q897_PYTIN|nr:hypothetical protein P43SY_008997 [Pythium insidiosum]KAJ0398953.1 hypothetical protein ATCC90586_000187 [Pythium insidiosum]